MDTFTTIPTKADETLPPTNADGGGGTSGQCVVSKEDVTLPPTNADGGGGTSGQALESGLPPPEGTRNGSLFRRLARTAFRFLRFSASSAGAYAAYHTWPQNDQEGEVSTAKLWSIYVGEAERYDAALVESWKADMQGMLIFSGLFSASLTAFLIESYKKLQPDSGDLTVALMTQMSQQLAAISTGSIADVQPPSQFTPTTASLVCNALWFVSLSLSLICALLATLVEQWAREFLHKTEMRPSPVRRARIFSFLYFGLKRFHMPAVVDAIPSLIHGSLLLFFAGLVAFLLPINHFIMYLMAGALILLLLVYSILTVLPVIYLDCPYRTPLSTPLWSVFQRIRAFFRTSLTPKPEIVTMTEAVVDSALQDTEKRDQRAVRWTLDSLTDEDEFLPFVEVIPDILAGKLGRTLHANLFAPVLGDVDTPSPLVMRISDLVVAAQGTAGVVDNPLIGRRYIAGMKALAALCMIPHPWEHRFQTRIFLQFSPDNMSYSVCVLAVAYQRHIWYHHLVQSLRTMLGDCRDPSSPRFRNQVLPTLRRRLPVLQTLASSGHYPIPFGFARPFSVPLEDLERLTGGIVQSFPTVSHLDQVRDAVDALDSTYDWAAECILSVFTFLSDAFHAVEQGISVFQPVFADEILTYIQGSRPNFIDSNRAVLFPQNLQKFPFSFPNPTFDHLAQIAFRLFPFVPQQGRLHPEGYLKYLVERENTEAIRYALSTCDAFVVGRSLSEHLAAHTGLVADRTAHAIVVLIGCIPSDRGAVEVADEIIAGISTQGYPNIRAIRLLRCLQRLAYDLLHLHYFVVLPGSSRIGEFQGICDNELFHPHSPVFLPPDADLDVLAQTLRYRPLDQYLGLLTQVLASTTPTSPLSLLPWVNIRPDPDFANISWSKVDLELQSTFFTALLAYCRVFLDPKQPPQQSERGYHRAFDERLWALSMFLPRISSEAYNVAGIRLSALRHLLEALELFQDAVERVMRQGARGSTWETSHSRALLSAVRNEIAQVERRAASDWAAEQANVVPAHSNVSTNLVHSGS
ncbi:hypothetical protein FB45DRAFT_1063767 [Roridomyces roridus]|uniref:DUF6535 domain-containing protein n=1 Tax=Roridomyces roridus TaxID=1738132 RepID=A0AAD7BDJ2_9AGAR|nr:hypothetical protein FB45DRAFT_1063767 [Roridomyces roridus]